MFKVKNTWCSNSDFYRVPEVYLASTPADLISLKEKLQGKDLAFDLETVGLQFWKCQILCVSLSVERGISFVIPLYLKDLVPVWEDINLPFNFLRELLGDEDTIKIGHNIKFDINVLRYNGVPVCGPIFDTMVAYGLLNENASKDLMTMADDFDLRYGKWDDALLEHVTKKDPNFANVPNDILHLYTGIDATSTFELFEKSRRAMRKENVYSIFTDISIPLLRVVMEMEYEGILIDLPLLEKYSREYKDNADKKLLEIRALTKDDNFNPNSPKQLAEKLAVSLQGGKKTKTGRPSTDEESLSRLVKVGNKLAELVLDLRGLVKTRSTFMEGFKELLDDNNHIHTSYSIAHTVTGRISSSHPNLQNIPRVRPGEANLRAMFTVEDGYVFLAADYAQMEQRMIAVLSGDTELLGVFERNEDIHRKFAALAYKKEPEAITKEERSKAKSVLFGSNYGQAASTLAENFGLQLAEAEFLMEQYFTVFPDMTKWRNNTHKEAMKNKVLVTPFGRKRRFVGYGFLQSPEGRAIADKFEIKLALNNLRNMAYNFKVQSTSSDYLSIATYNIWKELKDRKMKSTIIMSIHDAVNLKVFKPELKTVKDIITQYMEKVITIDGVSVQLKVDIKVGSRWEELEEEKEVHE